MAAAACAALLLAATACGAVRNAPPGGGTIVQGTYRIAPFNLNPVGQPGAENQGAPGQHAPDRVVRHQGDGLRIVYENGDPVPHSAVHLHHIVMMNMARQSPNCSQWPERFAAAGKRA